MPEIIYNPYSLATFGNCLLNVGPAEHTLPKNDAPEPGKVREESFHATNIDVAQMHLPDIANSHEICSKLHRGFYDREGASQKARTVFFGVWSLRNEVAPGPQNVTGEDIAIIVSVCPGS